MIKVIAYRDGQYEPMHTATLDGVADAIAEATYAIDAGADTVEIIDGAKTYLIEATNT
jgi:2,4-dienoyl-CoA reductase-like NADH-dependent reductase (Old Yellow Enzyme family)